MTCSAWWCASLSKRQQILAFPLKRYNAPAAEGVLTPQGNVFAHTVAILIIWERTAGWYCRLRLADASLSGGLFGGSILLSARFLNIEVPAGLPFREPKIHTKGDYHYHGKVDGKILLSGMIPIWKRLPKWRAMGYSV